MTFEPLHYAIATGLMVFLAVLILAAVFFIKLYVGSNRDLRKQAAFVFFTVFTMTIVWWLIEFLMPEVIIPIYKITLKVLATMTFLVLAFLVNQMINHYVWVMIFTDRNGRCAIPTFLIRSVAILVYALFIAAIVRFIFERSEAAIIAFSGGAAFILGYAAKEVISEIFAGIALNVAPAFKIGDYVKLNDSKTFYIVEDMNWRFTTFTGEDHNRVFIPNTLLTNMVVHNCQHNSLVIGVSFRSSFRSPPYLVIDILKERLSEIPEHDDTREISVDIDDFNKGYIIYTAVVPLKHIKDYYIAKTNIYKLIWKVLKDKGIDFYTPNLRFSLKESDEEKKLGFEEKEVLKIFKNVEIFKDFKESELKKLINSSHVREFIHPQRLIVCGAEDSMLYVIVKGLVSLQAPTKDDFIKIKELGPGMSVGIMSLITGEPRKTHVVAEETTIAYEICKKDLKSILDKNPHYVTKIAERIDEMLLEDERKSRKYKRDLVGEKKYRTERKKTLVGRLRTFFNIDS